MLLLGYLEYDPLVRVDLGPLSISPHGVGIAVGILAGAWLMRPAARARGISDDVLQALVLRGVVGAMIGARVAYVVNHLGSFDSPVEWFQVWNGGISLLGGLAGGILAAVPRLRREGLPFWSTLDAAVPGMALGIAVGRIGDLVVADHLGKPTDFVLGYVCPGTETASPCGAPVGQAVHQPALYDLVSAALLLGLLLWLRRKPHYVGFLSLVAGAWYGTGRIVEDFFRVDVTHGTGLTGSQWAALATVIVCLWSLVVIRRPPWAPRQATEVEEPAAEAEVDLAASSTSEDGPAGE